MYLRRTVINKAKVKFVNSLRLGKFRRYEQCFTAEGNTLVIDLIKSKLAIREFFATEKWVLQHRHLIEKTPYTIVVESELKKISNLKNPSEVMAVVNMPENKIPDIRLIHEWSLVLDNIRNPGNLGTIIRTADWFGFRSIFCSNETVDVYNPKVIQATMGSLSKVELFYTNLIELFAQKPPNFPVYGTLLQGTNINKLQHPQKGFVIVGSEAHGISNELLPYVNRKITIPSSPTAAAESLNASIATAIVCFALTRDEFDTKR